MRPVGGYSLTIAAMGDGMSHVPASLVYQHGRAPIEAFIQHVVVNGKKGNAFRPTKGESHPSLQAEWEQNQTFGFSFSKIPALLPVGNTTIPARMFQCKRFYIETFCPYDGLIRCIALWIAIGH